MIEAKHTSRFTELLSTLGWVLLAQVVLLMLTGLLLDGGYCGRIYGCSMAGYWLMVGWLALCRRNTLTNTDTILVRSGFLIWLAIALLMEFALERFAHA